MNEWFATTADVYRLTGELWDEHDQHASADNGPKKGAASRGHFLAASLARQETRGYVDFARLAQIESDARRGEWVSTCAPSVAVALLAATATSLPTSAKDNADRLSDDASPGAA